MSDTFIYVIFIDAPVERIWTGLTSGAFTQQYWAGRRIESDWQVGAPLHIYIDDTNEVEVSGKVLECLPQKRLSYTWNSSHGAAALPARVTFELETMGPSVKLTLTHEPLPPEAAMVRQGWAAIMSSLKSLLEAGRPLGATAMFRRGAGA